MMVNKADAEPEVLRLPCVVFGKSTIHTVRFRTRLPTDHHDVALVFDYDLVVCVYRNLYV